jgi:ribosomal protein S18 acetylase RimI-like enzyme
MTIDVWDAPTATTPVAIEPLQRQEAGTVIDVLVRGMRDNPVHVAAFGEDPDRRSHTLRKLFSLLSRKLEILDNARVARDADGAVVGVYSVLAPGSCRMKPLERVLMSPVMMMTLGIGNGRRAARWLGDWAKHDPDVPHWHFGPLAVDAHLQGKGIGSALMRDFCARMDAEGGTAYLETDKEINAHFYRKFGFEVIDEADVLGVPNWFMLRQPAEGARASIDS